MKAKLLVVALVFSAGCALFDSGTPWESGPYKLHWIDDPSSVALLQAHDDRRYTEVIPAQVFAVGLDSRYLVAQQHPGGDQQKVNYFILDRSFENAPHPDPSRITGPLNAAEFHLRSKQLGLPPFSKELASLK